ncbi:MAG: hypothetical protein AB1758_01395, partial [Candidatus Eremiobacterota bacterium]
MVEVDRILIMLGRRSWDPEPVRMMTRQLSPARAVFRSGGRFREGEEMKLILLLMPGCTLDMTASVTSAEWKDGECTGELALVCGFFEREKIRGFLKRFRVGEPA